MATTTYFSITLPGDNSQDWVTTLNRALSAITEAIVRTQLPAGATMQWGNAAGGKHLQISGSGQVQVVGGLDLGSTPTRNLGMPRGDEFPVDTKAGDWFFRTDLDAAYYRNAANDAWVLVNGLTSGVLGSLGALLVSDLGTDLGSFAVSDGAEGFENVVPGEDHTVLSADAESSTGWSLQTILALLGYTLAKGQIPVGMGGDATATALSPGSLGEVLVSDSAEPQGLRWSALVDLLALLLTDRGQLLAGGADGPVAVPVAGADTYVLISDASQPSGLRWVAQTDLGVIPNVRTRVGADLYLHANYL